MRLVRSDWWMIVIYMYVGVHTHTKCVYGRMDDPEQSYACYHTPSINPLLVDGLERVDDVALGLAHLLPLPVPHQPVHVDHLERRLAWVRLGGVGGG